MKKPGRQFEAVPIAQVPRKTVQLDDKKVVEKIYKKEEPYTVPARNSGESS